MDSVDGEFERLHPSHVVSRRPRHLFGKMIAISCLLHAVSTGILLSPRKNSTSSPAVSYLDLKDMKFLNQWNLQPR